MFPFYSQLLVCLLLIISGISYGLVLLLNSILFIIMLQQSTTIAIWLLLFEISTIIVIACLTIESRSFRRIFAILTLIFISILATLFIFCTLNLIETGIYSQLTLILFLSLIIFTKIPAYPFSFWLPEAHVEASWPGSVALAAFAMKYATFTLCSFLIGYLCIIDLINTIGLCGFLIASFGMICSSDVKKVVAQFSIVHMTLAYILLCNTNEIFDSSNISWHHHSMATGTLFTMIGIVYTISGSRIIRIFIGGLYIKDVLLQLLFLSILTVASDLPWVTNSLLELEVLRCNINLRLGIFLGLMISFLVIIMLFTKLGSIVCMDINIYSKLNSRIRDIILYILTCIFAILLFCII